MLSVLAFILLGIYKGLTEPHRAAQSHIEGTKTQKTLSEKKLDQVQKKTPNNLSHADSGFFMGWGKYFC